MVDPTTPRLLLGLCVLAASACSGAATPSASPHAGEVAPSWPAYLEGTWCDYRSVWRDGSRSEDHRIEWTFQAGRVEYRDLRTRIALTAPARVVDGRLTVSDPSLSPTFQLEVRPDGELRLHQAPLTFRRVRRGRCGAPKQDGYRPPALVAPLSLDPPPAEPVVSATARRAENTIPLGGHLALRTLPPEGCREGYVARLGVCVYQPFLAYKGEAECDRAIRDFLRGARADIVTADGKLFVFQDGAPAPREGESFVDVPLLDEESGSETLSAPTYDVPAPNRPPNPPPTGNILPPGLPQDAPRAAQPTTAPAPAPSATTGSSPERNQVEHFTNVDQP